MFTLTTSSKIAQYPKQNPQPSPDKQEELREKIYELSAIIVIALPHINQPPRRPKNAMSTTPPPTQKSHSSGAEPSFQNDNDNVYKLGDN